MEKLHKYLTDLLPHYLELLQQMVSINSFTANPGGVTNHRFTARPLLSVSAELSIDQP
jgi:hypothetical protein